MAYYSNFIKSFVDAIPVDSILASGIPSAFSPLSLVRSNNLSQLIESASSNILNPLETRAYKQGVVPVRSNQILSSGLLKLISNRSNINNSTALQAQQNILDAQSQQNIDQIIENVNNQFESAKRQEENIRTNQQLSLLSPILARLIQR